MTNARTTYRENDVRGSSRVRLVVLLYDQIIQDLAKAAQAIEQDQIELRNQVPQSRDTGDRSSAVAARL